jgi:hypothetical protein
VLPHQNACASQCACPKKRCTCTCNRNLSVNRKEQETALPAVTEITCNPVIQAAWISAAWTPLSTPPPLTAVQPNTPSSSQSSLPLNLLLKSRLDCPTSERHADRTPRIRAPHRTKQHPAKFWQNNQSPILRARQPCTLLLRSAHDRLLSALVIDSPTTPHRPTTADSISPRACICSSPGFE